jgi:hypothetical protein
MLSTTITKSNLFAIFAVFALAFFSSDLLAALPAVGTDGGDIATNTSGFFKKYATYIIYGSGAVVFIIASFWIISAISDWRAGKPGASLGSVALMFFIAIVATIIVMYLLTTGLDILEANF